MEQSQPRSSESRQKKLMLGLTGVRAYAAIWVVFYHYSVLGFLKPEDAALTFAQGHRGVDLFFVLSGFILCYSYIERLQDLTRQKFLDFAFRRFARLYPLHLATFLSVVFGFILLNMMGRPLQDPDSFGYFSGLLQVFMLHAWIPETGHTWNFVSWSVSAEWFAYLIVFPCCVLLWSRLSSWLILLIAFVFGFAYYGAFYSDRVSLELLRVSYGFVFGVFVYRLMNGFKLCLGKVSVDLMMAATLALIAIGVAYPESFVLKVASVPLFGLIIALLSLEKGMFYRLFSNRAAVYLGTISYSVYLVHGVFYRLLSQIDKQFGQKILNEWQIDPWYSLIVGLFVTLFISHFAYVFIEEKGQKLLLAWFKPRSKRSGT